MQAFSVNHITNSPHYLQSKELTEKYVQTEKCLFSKAKEERKDFHKCLMIYCNTLLTGRLKMLMQFLQGRTARSDLPMFNASRKKFELKLDVLRNIDKHENCLHMINMLDNM